MGDRTARNHRRAKVDRPWAQAKPTDALVLLEESTARASSLTAFEDEHGTYIMNSQGICAPSS